MEPPQVSQKCEWHNDIQSKLTEVKNLVVNHQQQELSEEQSIYS